MGLLSVIGAGPVYFDACAIIYSVERHRRYAEVLDPVWMETHAGRLDIVTSEISLLECLVAPIKRADPGLVGLYESVLQGRGVRLVVITQPILRDAARLRAEAGIKTPDAIHAATALAEGCELFVTNDADFRRVSGLNVALLSDLISP